MPLGLMVAVVMLEGRGVSDEGVEANGWPFWRRDWCSCAISRRVLVFGFGGAREGWERGISDALVGVGFCPLALARARRSLRLRGVDSSAMVGW